MRASKEDKLPEDELLAQMGYVWILPRHSIRILLRDTTQHVHLSWHRHDLERHLARPVYTLRAAGRSGEAQE